MNLSLRHVPKSAVRLTALAIAIVLTGLGTMAAADATDPPTAESGGAFWIEEATHYTAHASCTSGGNTLRQGAHGSADSAREKAISWVASTCVLFSSSSVDSYTYHYYRWTATCSEPPDIPPASGTVATYSAARDAQNAWLEAQGCESFTSSVTPLPEMTATAYRWNATCRVPAETSSSESGLGTRAAAIDAKSSWGTSTCAPAGGTTSVGSYQAFQFKARCNDGSRGFVGSWHQTKSVAESEAQAWISAHCLQ